MFQVERRAQFDQCDPGGVLFYGQFFSLSHQAIEAYITSLNIQWKDWFDHREWAIPIRHTEADYFLPVPAGSEFQIKVRLESVGNSSVQFQTQFSSALGLHAEVRSVHVFVDRAQRKKREIPKMILSLLESELGK